MTHYDTFRDQLAIAHPAFGHALWEPDPREQYPPVEVGDVGFIRQGKFHRLFNALLPANHQSHQRFGVPEHYEPLQLTESGGSDFFAVAPPTSDSAEVTFSSTRKHGAALSLPVEARREDTLSQAHFGTWMIRHIDSWFAFSQRHGLGIRTEDIVLVTGSHRTRSWSNIAFYESRVDSRVSLRVQAPGIGTTVHWQVLSQRIQGAVLSRGPSGENLPENQCLFIRGFRVKRNLLGLPRLKGAAEPKSDPPGNDRDPETELVLIPSVTERPDPLHVLLEYIATRAPGCDMALVHDDDLVRILGVGDLTSVETLQRDVVMDYLQKSKLEIGVMSDSWISNNESPRTAKDTRRMNVAMLSEQLHNLRMNPVSSTRGLNSRTSRLTMHHGTHSVWNRPGLISYSLMYFQMVLE
ncbi:hypothetical protein H4582DRAFT_1463515 [Lactarius indigo]|nr:hypothetical protein H4582DRAFT_1463515 [Lactarius indigo]